MQVLIFYLYLALNVSFEIFPLFLNTVLSHGADDVGFFLCRRLNDFPLNDMYVPCKHVANEHALLNRKHFPTYTDLLYTGHNTQLDEHHKFQHR
jgi:hypothetical protein